MELALLVYAISMLTPITTFLCFTAFVSSVAWVVSTLMCFVEGGDPPQLFRPACWIAAISTVLLIGIPTEKTAYLMVGAYSAQKIAERPETAELTKDVMTIINAKVKKYAEEAVDDLKKDSK